MGDGGDEGAAGVDRATIAREVIARLAQAAGVAPDTVHEQDDLAFDLGFGDDDRRALAADYDAIIAAHHGAPVTLDDAGDLSTVKDAVDLVFHRVGGHAGGDDAGGAA